MNNSNKKKTTKEKYIAIADIAFNLGLLESDVEEWLLEDQPLIKLDHRERQCVSSVYMDRLSKDNRYEEAKRKSLESENIIRTLESYPRNERLVAERKNLLENYSKYISDLEYLHKSCRERVNFHHHESAVTAAYLLFSKVISCLKMGVLSLEHGFWFGGSVIREIDEALDLAHYFIICKFTGEGKATLHKWFRHNHAPNHSVCREAISSYMAELIDDIDQQNHKDLMNELYQSKSKWTHPTYSSIREVTQFDTTSGIDISNIEYGRITFEYKLVELTHFFYSSIWSSFQVFQVCFSSNLPLTEEENKEIRRYDELFQQQKINEW